MKGIRPQKPLELGSFDPRTERIVGSELDTADPRHKWLAERWDENERNSWRVAKILELFKGERFALDHESTQSARDNLDRRTRKFLDEQFGYVVNTLAFELKESFDQAKIELERNSDARNTESPAFRQFLATKHRYEEVVAAGGYRLGLFLGKKADLAVRVDFRRRFLERIEELSRYHFDQRRDLMQQTALLNLLSSYERIGIFSTRLAPALPNSKSMVEIVNSESGSYDIKSTSTTLMQMVGRAKGRLGLDDSLKLPPKDDWGNMRGRTDWACSQQAAYMWGRNGYPISYPFN
jgi:hypothetical protein